MQQLLIVIVATVAVVAFIATTVTIFSMCARKFHLTITTTTVQTHSNHFTTTITATITTTATTENLTASYPLLARYHNQNSTLKHLILRPKQLSFPY